MLKPSKIIVSIILTILLVSTIVPISTSAYETPLWDKSYSFSQEIPIPIDTSKEQAKFQPIDIHIDFNSPCWAKNSKEHSVRVIFEKGRQFKELECQIYDLKQEDETYISACNLVFLIPEEADGSENYRLYYDESEKKGPDYNDHVQIKESYYRYEPIPGYPLDANYYEIIDDDYSIYQITYKGSSFGSGASQGVGKLQEGAKEATLQNGELFATFEFSYYDKNAKVNGDETSTRDKFVSKEILVDGNLMIEVGIISKSKNDEIQTTNYYKYYHCPTPDKRLHVHVKHEANKNIDTMKKNDVATDGEYLSLETGFTKSSAIKELNFGKMLPYMHFHHEKDFISEYKIDPDPEKLTGVFPIKTGDDVDIGTDAWACFDEGEEGASHALILDSNSVLKSGSNERDGVQIKLYEQDNPHLKGLEVNHAGFLLTRNTYEIGEDMDYTIPEDFCAEFFVDFYSSQSGGYLIVPEEAEIFQNLVKVKPSNNKVISTDAEKTGDNFLTVFLHNTLSPPLGFGLSVLTGLNVSYETIEVYKDGDMLRSGTPSKIDMNQLPADIVDTGLSKARSLLPSFDWKNMSIFKKIHFSDLMDGRYVVKIYRNNCKFGVDKKLIGFKIINVEDNATSHIFCRSSGMISFSVFDQNDIPVSDVECKLVFDNVVISNGFTSEQGEVIFTAPVFLKEKYVLSLNYKGFKIFEEPINLGIKNILKPLVKKISIERHNLKLRFFDTWGFPFNDNVDPYLSSNDAYGRIILSDIAEDKYIFNDLLSSKYNLHICYKSEVITKEVSVDSDKEIEITLPVEYKLSTNVFNIRGEDITNCNFVLSRMGKKIEFSSSDSDICVPPGVYDITVYSNGNLVSKSKVEITGDSIISIVTNEEPLYPSIVIVLSLLILFAAGFIFFRKKDYSSIVVFIAIALCVVSLVLPWWSINGISESGSVETSSNMFLIPTNLVTMTSNSDVFAGDISFIPDIFALSINIVSLLIAMGCILLFLSILIKKRFSKKVSSILLFFGFLSIVCSIGIFSFAMSEFANVSIGSFVGSGSMDVGIPSGSVFESVFCTWGPGIGFYFMLVSLFLVLTLFVFRYKKDILGFVANKPFKLR